MTENVSLRTICLDLNYKQYFLILTDDDSFETHWKPKLNFSRIHVDEH